MNKFGLSRDIPVSIKREIRQRDGFGCVVCGNALFDYEHFRPPFSEAVEHTSSGIILLCPNCHRKKGAFLSLDTIAAAALDPKCKQIGFSFETFDLGLGHPEIHLGNLVMRRVCGIIDVFGEEIISIEPAEIPGGPFRISADLRGLDGSQILSIVRNEWRTPVANWDVDVTGGVITIRQKRSEIIFRLRSSSNILVFERLNIHHRGVRISVDEKQQIEVLFGGTRMLSSGATLEDFKRGLIVLEDRLVLGSGGGSIRMEDIVFSNRRSTPMRNALLARNAMCDCGSGNRYKRCCGIVQ